MVKLPSPAIAKTAFSAFERGVERMMARNYIRTPPIVKISEANCLASPAIAHFNPKDPVGLIEIHPKLAAEGDTPITRGVVAHEMGHILSDLTVGIGAFGQLTSLTPSNVISAKSATHGGIKTQAKRLFREITGTDLDLLKQYRAQELEADRLAVFLTGSHDDVLKMRRAASPGGELLPDFTGTTILSRIKSPLNYVYNRINFSLAQGGRKEIEQNIRGVDLTNRNHVESLIAKRNEASKDAKSFIYF